MTTKELTPEQQIVLQSFLIRAAEQWQQYQREYPGLLDLASYHVAPDGAWISVEHEEVMCNPETVAAIAELDELHREAIDNFTFARLSPACTHLVTKI